MYISEYGVRCGCGWSIPNTLEEITKREDDEEEPMRIRIVMTLNQEELKKFLKFKKSLDKEKNV